MANRIAGKVKYFDRAEGKGIITPDDGSEDLKIYYVDLQTEFGNYQTLGVDTEVEFYVQFLGEKKVKVAKNVTGKNGGHIPLKRRIFGDPAAYASWGSQSCEKCIVVNGIYSICGFEEKAVYGGGSHGGGSSSGDARGRGGSSSGDAVNNASSDSQT